MICRWTGRPGSFAAGGAASGDAADLAPAFADPSIERQPPRTGFEDEAAGHRVVPRGMEFSGDGQRFLVVTSDQEGTGFWPHTIRTREALAPSRFVDVTHGPAVAGGRSGRPDDWTWTDRHPPRRHGSRCSD
ncbi:hypothetical protein [Streptomyces caelestis]|uniref:hypothetical protein n=1 Tax=Streptomyces caelestis TaxID=36816 RepID=UPI003668D540